ncbi:MAG: SDR family NAD(P)-dependent oxidoreductase, partial [Acidimicrobiales bacterium]|nr:SDR family NAD(P)-dependent oxidoreductase [Acidimicrobiales bacterium]
MQDLNGKLAVVTGGASGLGLAFAHRFAAEGMRIAIADIEEPVLDQAVAELEATGADVIGVRCDVSDHDSVRNLKVAVDEAFGAAHLLCLNAGVASNGLIVE